MRKENNNEASCISVQEYPGGILALDSGFVRDRMAACYILEAGHELAIIETGVNASVSRILSVLAMRGWERSQVRYVIATHVHLDHAGGAGQLMQELPGATFLVHPRGARHMIDPARLEGSARAVYGDEIFEGLYGKLVPIEPSRVRAMGDGETVRLGTRQLTFMDSPGHARHHFCVFDEQTRGWFSGDTFGLSYRELDTANGVFIFPTTTPVEFDPAALRQSVQQLADSKPDWMYLTHYGRVGGVEQLAPRLLSGIDILVEIGERHVAEGNRFERIRQDIAEWLNKAARDHGVQRLDEDLHRILWTDIQLNAQGIEAWLQRREKAALQS